MKEQTLAIPSKGRIKDETLDLLSDAGIEIRLPGRQLTVVAEIPEVGKFTVSLMRPKDIVKLVAVSQIPIGIVGSDTVDEYNLQPKRAKDEYPVQGLLNLGIGRCRLVIATPEERGFISDEENNLERFNRSGGISYINGVEEQLRGATFATSYPNITKEYFLGRDIMLDTSSSFKFQIIELGGSVETAPALGLADAIVDLVETGDSLRDNGLKELSTIFKTEGVLITNNTNQKGDSLLVDALAERLYQALLRRNNPDALAQKKAMEQAIDRFAQTLSSYRYGA